MNADIRSLKKHNVQHLSHSVRELIKDTCVDVSDLNDKTNTVFTNVTGVNSFRQKYYAYWNAGK